MPASPFDLIEGDIGTVMDIPVVDEDGNAVDLTGATGLIWHWQHGKKEPVTKTPSIQDAIGGILRYTTVLDDIEKEDLRVQVELTTLAGWHGRTDPVFYKVGRKLVKGL